ncbi:MAG: hypothetical protein O7E52_08075 [Candidatus Poribacteria bacterium]|nr:hypothetical protein [Candidatus Poribacteria bacterium]
MNKGMKNKRVVVFAAYPKLAGQLRTIFSSTEGSIRRQLENPPILHDRPWSLQTFDQARIIRGEMIRVKYSKDKNRDLKIIDLYRDGTLIFAALTDPNFLGWRSFPDDPWIHPIAIVEVIYNFIDFYKRVLEDFVEKPEEITIRTDLRNMHLKGVKTYLPLFFNDLPPVNEILKQRAPENSGTILRDFRTADFHVGVVAFEILKEIYLWFGLEEDKIRYTKTKGELKMIDPEAIAKIG